LNSLKGLVKICLTKDNTEGAIVVHVVLLKKKQKKTICITGWTGGPISMSHVIGLHDGAGSSIFHKVLFTLAPVLT